MCPKLSQEIKVCPQCKSRHMPEHPYVNGICEGCNRLNAGYYSDPLTIAHTIELVAMVKDLQAENAELKAQLEHMTTRLAEQITQDARETA